MLMHWYRDMNTESYIDSAVAKTPSVQEWLQLSTVGGRWTARKQSKRKLSDFLLHARTAAVKNAHSGET